ncbi:MAG: site-specific integrase [Myxococcales bacterium]|nr:site-specific integrase [Myxococcales bacterium]
MKTFSLSWKRVAFLPVIPATMSARKLKGAWWIDISLGGKRHRFKSPHDSKGAAQDYEALLRREFATHGTLDRLLRPQPEVRPITFAEFSERWMREYVAANNKPSEQRAKRYILAAHLLPVFGKRPLDTIKAAELESLKSTLLRERGVSAKTVNNILAVLQRCLAVAVEWEVLARAPRVKPLPATLPPVRFLDPSDIAALLAATPPGYWRTMVLTIFRAGLRIGELIALEWRDIDFAHRLITVRRSWVKGHLGTPKAHKIRYVPLATDLADAFRALPTSSARVFGLEMRDPYQFVRRRMLWFGRAAKISAPGWHLLRHTFATELTRNDVNLLVTRDLLGHSTVRMTERYAHVNKPELREAIMTLENAAPGRSWHQEGNRSGFTEAPHASIPHAPLHSPLNQRKTPRSGAMFHLAEKEGFEPEQPRNVSDRQLPPDASSGLS